jgi:hypothetical protein
MVIVVLVVFFSGLRLSASAYFSLKVRRFMMRDFMILLYCCTVDHYSRVERLYDENPVMSGTDKSLG